MAFRAAHERGAAAAALLACAFLLGCAGGGIGGGGDPAAAVRERFEGLYQGQQIPSGTSDATACRGRAREVWFAVENGTVEMRNTRQTGSRRRSALAGTVSVDGSVAMRRGKAGRQVVGRIEGGRLTAATVQDAQNGGARKAPCAYRYEATRAGPSGPGSAAAAPPVEGFPQP